MICVIASVLIEGVGNDGVNKAWVALLGLNHMLDIL